MKTSRKISKSAAALEDDDLDDELFEEELLDDFEDDPLEEDPLGELAEPSELSNAKTTSPKWP